MRRRAAKTIGALIAYRKALEGDPALAAAHTNLGNLLYRRGERGEARTAYEAALALDPEQPEARYNLGNLLDDVGEHDGARMEWIASSPACPEFADAHFNLAVACAARRRPRRGARCTCAATWRWCPTTPRAVGLLDRL